MNEQLVDVEARRRTMLATELEPLDTEAPEVPETDQALGRKVGRGAVWAAASNLVLRFASIAVTALLARLLTKQDFGVFVVALAVFLVVTSLAELGMGSAIARSAMEPEDIAPTVATISIMVSGVLAALMALTAPQLAGALGQPDAANPIRVLSLCTFLTGVFAVPGAQLVRDFRQDKIFLATIVGFVVANPVLVVLALNGGGAMSFAWSRVIGQLATGVVYVLCTSRNYRPGWHRAVVGPLIRFGIPLSLANLVNYTLLNADYAIIGRLLDAAELGVYVIAFNVANWSTAVMGSVLNSVVVPAFGRVLHDRAKLTSALESACRLVGIIAFPIGAMTIALSKPLVETVFGRQWSASAPVLSILAVYGVLYAFSLLFANVLVATGATMRLLIVQIAWVAVLVPMIYLWLHFDGLRGAGWAHVLTIAAVAIPIYLSGVLRSTSIRFGAVFAAIRTPLSGAALAGVAAWSVAHLGSAAWLNLVVGSVVGGLVYLIVTGRTLAAYAPQRIQQIRLLAPKDSGHRRPADG